MKEHGGTLENGAADFSASVSPLGSHPAVERVLRRFSLNPSALSAYPDIDCGPLRLALSEFWNFPPNQIVCGSGAVDLIFSVASSLEFSSCLILEGAFSEYERAVRASGRKVGIRKSSSVDGLISLVEKNSLLFAASPSNPEGKILDFDEVRRIERKVEEAGGIFVLDCCFAEFSARSLDVLKKIILHRESFPNLLVLNAFTKFYGMAGLRVGYALCFRERFSAELSGKMRPWAVSSLAQTCASEVLSDEIRSNGAWGRRMRSFVEGEKSRFSDFLAREKIEFRMGGANFFLCELDFLRKNLDKDESCAHFFHQGRKIVLRRADTFSGFGGGWFRISVMGRKENDLLMDAISSAKSQGGQKGGGEKSPGARAIMVQGTASDAGKSVIAAALCRIFARDGFAVAPFKSQNMALNSGVTADGKEMGRAQIVQAKAAFTEPDVRMNPILLKPDSVEGSQVVLCGEPVGRMRARDYFSFRKSLVPRIVECFESLSGEFDIIVVEGAGSPAEINLRENDIVNMGLAEVLDCPVIIAADIDRGGSFASLYGTFALLSEAERGRVAGFLLNRFRGDRSLLDSGISELERMTGRPVLGVVPFLEGLRIDGEDSLSLKGAGSGGDFSLLVFVVKFPFISNFTDISPIERLPFVRVEFVSSLREFSILEMRLGKPDLLVLPGTKNSVRAMEFLEREGLSGKIREFAVENPVFGICGGFQVLGRTLDDSSAFESGEKKVLGGLSLLPVRTVFGRSKRLSRVEAEIPHVSGFFGALSGIRVCGYEIHHGATFSDSDERLSFSASGFAFGTYLHGIFDSVELMKSVISLLCARKGIPVPDVEPFFLSENLEFDRLEDAVRKSVDVGKIYGILGVEKNRRVRKLQFSEHEP